MLKKLGLGSIVVIMSLSLGHIISAQSVNKEYTSNLQLEYPANKKEEFKSADDFYTSLNTNEYKEFKDSKNNIRAKILYKDTNNINKELKNIAEPDNSIPSLSHIDPNRQVYFFASVLENDEKIVQKYVVYDAETKNILNASIQRYSKTKDAKGWTKAAGISDLSSTED